MPRLKTDLGFFAPAWACGCLSERSRRRAAALGAEMARTLRGFLTSCEGRPLFGGGPPVMCLWVLGQGEGGALAQVAALGPDHQAAVGRGPVGQGEADGGQGHLSPVGLGVHLQGAGG